MDRRFFVTSLLTASGILAVTIGTANALPALASRDLLAPADDGNIETVWWAPSLASSALASALAALVKDTPQILCTN